MRLSNRCIVCLMYITSLLSVTRGRTFVDRLTDYCLNDPCKEYYDATGYTDFDGADAYFTNKLVSLRESGKAAAQRLRVQPAPSSSQVTIALRDIWQDRSALKINTYWGVGTEMKSCFSSNSSYSDVCTDLGKGQAVFRSFRDSWTYRQYCNGSRAIFTTVSVTFTSAGIVKVVLLLEVDLERLDVNQCNDSSDFLFAGTHRCPSNTRCQAIAGRGFRIGAYRCQYIDCAGCTPIDGLDPQLYGNTTDIPPESTTPGVTAPSSAGSHDADYLWLLGLLVLHGLCVLLCLVLAIVIIIHRSSKAIQSAKCLILQLILLGAIIIYSSLVLRFCSPSLLICILQPWFREIGFICVYGALILKTYKSLAEFQTRKARRVHVRDQDLLKYWLFCLLLIIAYMAAWTALTQHYIHGSLEMIVSPPISVGAVCLLTGWNYVTQLSELLVVAFGLYMSYRLRSAPSVFWESQYIAAVLTIEFIVSSAYYIVSDIMVLSLSPWWQTVMSSMHIQLTITLLILIIYPAKLWFIRHPPKDGTFITKGGNSTDLVDFRVTNKPPGNGEPDIGEINLTEMTPDEIKKELRRVYTQLQTYKVKVMRYENPHIHGKRQHKKPFYKQLSRQNKRHSNSAREGEIDMESTAEEPELVPLNETTCATDQGVKPRQHTAAY